MARFDNPERASAPGFSGLPRSGMRGGFFGLLSLLVLMGLGACGQEVPDAQEVSLLIRGGTVYDGTGGEPFVGDVAISEDRIVFVGDADAEGIQAETVVDATGLAVAPGFIDMHSHAELSEDYGWDGAPFLHQGITTVAMGVDGGGTDDVRGLFRGWTNHGIGVNAFHYVGHGFLRRQVLGYEDRAPSAEELEEMKARVRRAMEEGAFGLSSGLFYVPGTYAETEEVIELSRVAAEFDGAIYDTHDRDLGAVYKGVGYDASVMEGIRIGEESGARVIFSHFNPQSVRNYGRAEVGARLIEEARARGVEVWAAQHPYTATQSNLRSYTIPDWAVVGGDTAMIRRFDHPDTVLIIQQESSEMLAIRGGADKILFGDPRPELNGKTLADVADEWGVSGPEAARRILREGNAVVMNLDLYDIENTRYLAQKDWMMTCTDGRTPAAGQAVVHPRVYGAFPRKMRLFALEDSVISVPFAIRSFTGLAADFLRLQDRGYLRPGMQADVTVLDLSRYNDPATYQDPHQYAEGAVHVLVNGMFAIQDGNLTGTLAGVPLARP
jgi:N-acyl-D-amino-acid deacylase